LAVWYSLWSFGIFFPIWYVWTKKNRATLVWLIQDPSVPFQFLAILLLHLLASSTAISASTDRPTVSVYICKGFRFPSEVEEIFSEGTKILDIFFHFYF
jgi:hypothetical protein